MPLFKLYFYPLHWWAKSICSSFLWLKCKKDKHKMDTETWMTDCVSRLQDVLQHYNNIGLFPSFHLKKSSLYITLLQGTSYQKAYKQFIMSVWMHQQSCLSQKGWHLWSLFSVLVSISAMRLSWTRTNTSKQNFLSSFICEGYEYKNIHMKILIVNKMGKYRGPGYVIKLANMDHTDKELQRRMLDSNRLYI